MCSILVDQCGYGRGHCSLTGFRPDRIFRRGQQKHSILKQEGCLSRVLEASSFAGKFGWKCQKRGAKGVLTYEGAKKALEGSLKRTRRTQGLRCEPPNVLERR